MNKSQKIVLVIGITVLVFLACFPPWYGVKDSRYSKYETLGYGFILGRKQYENYKGRQEYYYSQRIDFTRFSLPFVSVALIAGGLLVLLKGKSS